MANKKDQLTKAMKRPRKSQRPLGYRRMTVTLYTPEADYVDQLAQLFKRSGIRSRSPMSTNRSLVIQQLILFSQESLEGMSRQELVKVFKERVEKRLARL